MGKRAVTFSWDEVARLLAIARSPAAGRTLEQRVEETIVALDELIPHTTRLVWSVGGAEVRNLHGTMDAADVAAYLEHYRHHDPMTPYAPRYVGRVLCMSDVATRRQVDRTAMSELLRRASIAEVAGFSLPLGAGGLFLFSIHRGPGAAPFRPKERALIELVAPIAADFVREDLASARPDLDLSPMQRAVAELAAAGLGDREIARELGIGFASVRTHLLRAFAKTGARSRTHLAALLRGEPGMP